ncbi:RPM1-interacting protein 4 (RIN4) family protein [Striga hermonthica]|uniref:RPM1-interacting protein 4 (RIN4) family protein n=1 Tax=Striga hermonthica TaxID=68872 RepID=A0A9N7N2D0_STRHE|nr:RPM1-interacting protein 4 (RIN4) family protein [Striga hermonthica]
MLRPLPKFGEWDVNNPASADGFTVIFAKARDEKKSKGTAASTAPPPSIDTTQTQQYFEDQNKVGDSGGGFLGGRGDDELQIGGGGVVRGGWKCVGIGGRVVALLLVLGHGGGRRCG